jgi:hypothetical protein
MPEASAYTLIPTSSGELDAEAYQELVVRVRAAAREVVPAGSTVLVVSKGDDEFLKLDGCRGWHFPQEEGGGWSGHHPADSAEAIGQLEELKAKGAGYLILPSTALWWLEHYSELRVYLQEHCDLLLHEESCLVFALAKTGGETDSAVLEHEDLVHQLRDVVHSLLPPGAVVAVVSRGDDELIALPGQDGWHFPRTEAGKHVGYFPDDSEAAIEHLRTLEARGAQFLVVPRTAFRWLDRHPALLRDLRRHQRFVTRQKHVCEIYELGGADHGSAH